MKESHLRTLIERVILVEEIRIVESRVFLRGDVSCRHFVRWNTTGPVNRSKDVPSRFHVFASHYEGQRFHPTSLNRLNRRNVLLPAFDVLEDVGIVLLRGYDV